MSVIFPFISPVNGISFYKEKAIRAKIGDHITILRDRDNRYDVNAFKILHNNNLIGFLPKEISFKLANLTYETLVAEIHQVLSTDKGFGLRIRVQGPNKIKSDLEIDEFIDNEVEKILVKNKQGRILGEFVSLEGDKVRVKRENMSDILYPAKLTNILN